MEGNPQSHHLPHSRNHINLPPIRLPACLKSSNGFVLPKSGKTDYTTPRSFRVIVLDTFSNTFEKVIQACLSTTTHTKRACLCPLGRLPSTNASRGHCCTPDARSRCGSVSYLVSWAGSFLSGRSITLICPSALSLSVPVSVGVLQGPPVSPLFFVIYVAPLHTPDSISLRLSYVDNFSVTVTPPSYEQSVRKLAAAFDPGRLYPCSLYRSHPLGDPQTEICSSLYFNPAW